jgi:hypothetical protein
MLAVVAGCGGSSGSEDMARERLEAAAAKTAAAPTLEATSLAEVEGADGPTATGCTVTEVDRAAPVKIAERTYRTACGHGRPAETIAIGDRGWYSPRPGHWIRLTIAPGVTAGVADDGKRFDRLFAAASNFVETADGGEFDAPVSANLPGPSAESGDLHLEAKIDGAGYLSALTVAGAEEDPPVTLKDNYRAFGKPQRITPPPPDRNRPSPRGDQDRIRTSGTLPGTPLVPWPPTVGNGVGASWVGRLA